MPVELDLNLPLSTDPALARSLKLAWREAMSKLNNFMTVYHQDTQPVIPDNTMSMWVKSDGSCHIVVNFGQGVIKVWGQT